MLDFEKPKKVKIDAQFDGGPPGAYVPQMSNEDAERWKAKHFNKGKRGERIEIRKTFDGAQVFIIVAKAGWDLASKNEVVDVSKPGADKWPTWEKVTKDYNVRMSMNGPIMMSFAVWDEFIAAIEEAKSLF